MLLTMLSARLPCSAIFSRLPVSISIVSSISARLSSSSVASAGRRGLLQLVQQLDRQAGEVVDEVERVLDLVRDAGGQLAERGHLLGLDQVGLRRLQLLVRLAQFLLAAALLLEQLGVAHRQRRLGGEGLDEFNGLRGEIAKFAAQHDKPAEDAVLEQQRDGEQRVISGPAELVPAFRGDEIGRVRQIGHLDRRAGHRGLADRALAASHRIGAQMFGYLRFQPVAGAIMKLFALGIVLVNHAGVRAGELDGAGDHHPEHGFRVEGRADRAPDAAQRLEARQGLAQVAHRIAKGAPVHDVGCGCVARRPPARAELRRRRRDPARFAHRSRRTTACRA